MGVAEKCKCCGTRRFKILSRGRCKGLCERCCSDTQNIEQCKAWNPADLSTLKGCPSSIIPLLYAAQVEQMREDVIAQWNNRMTRRRAAEEGPISSLGLEYEFERIGTRWIGEKKARQIMHGAAITFDSLEAGERQNIYLYLFDIEERAWRVDWTRFISIGLRRGR